MTPAEIHAALIDRLARYLYDDDHAGELVASTAMWAWERQPANRQAVYRRHAERAVKFLGDLVPTEEETVRRAISEKSPEFEWVTLRRFVTAWQEVTE